MKWLLGAPALRQALLLRLWNLKRKYTTSQHVAARKNTPTSGEAGKETHPRERGGKGRNGVDIKPVGRVQADSKFLLRNAWKNVLAC
ncbi:hypothetical protein TNCV_1717611 [Trichonephila clavipes]|nr:hypothetical protein TNCV_1717611 [Trichonephila clavipes]